MTPKEIRKNSLLEMMQDDEKDGIYQTKSDKLELEDYKVGCVSLIAAIAFLIMMLIYSKM